LRYSRFWKVSQSRFVVSYRLFGKTSNPKCVTSLKNEDLIYTEAKAWNQTEVLLKAESLNTNCMSNTRTSADIAPFTVTRHVNPIPNFAPFFRKIQRLLYNSQHTEHLTAWKSDESGSDSSAQTDFEALCLE
jgi:hypothetical protein